MIEQDAFVASQIAEIKVALDKITKYSPQNAAYHCGRITAAAWALCKYISLVHGAGIEDESGYVRPTN
jgi:hypothetical protein